MEQWIDFTTQEIDAPMLSWFLPIIGFMEYNQKVSGCECCVLDGWSIHRLLKVVAKTLLSFGSMCIS